MRVQLTKRDFEIICFINEFGFCIMPQIERRFGIKKPLSYRLMKRLIRAGLVEHRRIFHSQHGIYYATANGAKCTDLPVMNTLAIGRYEHQLIVTDVYIKLHQQYPESAWISERHLKHEKFYDGIGKRGHVSDGILIFPNNRKVAIEVELNMKGKYRIERILKNYATQFSIQEVWYYCPKNLVSSLTNLAEKLPFIKIYNLTSFLHGE